MKAIGYVRISTRDQSKYSLDDQAEAIRDYCTRNNLELLTLFRDNGEHSDTFDRADFLALEDFVKKHKGNVRYLIVMDHDRFSRDLAEALQKIRQLERKYKIKVLSIDEPLDLDVNDPDVFLQRAFKYLMANQELLKIRKRTRRGIHNAAAAGRYVRAAPFGYRNDRDENGKGIIVVDEAKAPIIQKIFELYLSGMPYFLIGKEVRKMGFPRTGNGSIQLVLGNCVYAGLIKVPAYNNNPERYVKGLHQPLIAESDFWKVQEMMGKMKKVRQPRPVEDMPLRGIVQCWCGRKMTAGLSKGKKKHYLYYICTQHRNLSIPGKTLHGKLVEILSHLNLSKDQTEYLGQIARSKLNEALEKRKQGLTAKNKDLQETEKKIDRLESKLLDGEIESGTYKKWYAKYMEEKGAIEREIHRLKNSSTQRWHSLVDKMGLLNNLDELYANLSITQKHRFLNGVFNRGLIYADDAYRTPWLHPALSHNQLILKEKGLLYIEQPSDIWNKIPVSSP